MKKILIAEKPDQAKSFYLPLLEQISGEQFERKDGYYESKSYYLTWFFGHLLEQIKPDEYDTKYEQWLLEDLPIIPDKMIYKYKGSGQSAQGKTINELCKKSSEIICGTDPDREGQGIFDTFIKYNNINVPMKRLWATSLTEKDLMKAWSKLKDHQEYKLLSIARELRADSDWLVGMNASRAYSIIGKGNLPIGRVLTATLAIIVKRDFEVANYKESYFYQLKGAWSGIVFTYWDNGTKFDERITVENVKSKCCNTLFSLCDFKEEIKTENPPKTFNLPDLQKEANKKYGFSLDKTLELAQSLYEKKMTTYPRTDSAYLPESDLLEYHTLVRKIASKDELPYLRAENEKPACVKNTESPHTALVVTGEKSTGLTNDEEKIYELIRSRFVCAFMVARKYTQYDLEIKNESEHKFKAVIKTDIDSGFRNLYKEEEKEEDVQVFNRVLNVNELNTKRECIKDLSIQECKKAKPKHYTPATLITAMQTCGRSLENEDARKMLSETKGIGTPATQAMYPKQLMKYEYISEDKGCYISTNKGRKLIEVISPDLKTPELTADWEMQLKMVESGKLSNDLYRKNLHAYICRIVDESKKRQGCINISEGEKTTIPCPSCGKVIYKKSWGYACENKEACSFSVNSKISDKTISDKEIEGLLLSGETSTIKGFKKKDKSGTFDAKLIIKEENGKKIVGFSFESLTCPKCKKGTMRFFDWGVACSDRDGCSYKLFREICHKKLTDDQFKKILTGKIVNVKGMKSAKGNGFDANLSLKDDYSIKFDFNSKAS